MRPMHIQRCMLGDNDLNEYVEPYKDSTVGRELGEIRNQINGVT